MRAATMPCAAGSCHVWKARGASGINFAPGEAYHWRRMVAQPASAAPVTTCTRRLAPCSVERSISLCARYSRFTGSRLYKSFSNVGSPRHRLDVHRARADAFPRSKRANPSTAHSINGSFQGAMRFL
jgi:hypothetical protein